MWNAYCERRMDMRRRTMAGIGLMVIVCLVFLCGCGKQNDPEKNVETGKTLDEKKEKTEKEDQMEVRNNGEAIQWREDAEDEWHDLVKLADLRGESGRDGISRADGQNIEIRKEVECVQWRYTDGTWKNLVELSSLVGPSGQDNGSVELQMTETEIQWRRSDGEWKKLVGVADIAGPSGEKGKDGVDGKTAEFRVEGDSLQWRYEGNDIWLNLYDLSSLKGNDGVDGKDGDNGKDGTDGKDGSDGRDGVDGVNGKTIEVKKTDEAVQWRYEGEEWTDLVLLSDITGPAGMDGVNGKTPEFRVNDDALQWRYEGDDIWLNLYDLSSLKGADGRAGEKGEKGEKGENGDRGTDGRTPEIRVNGNQLQWKYNGETEWKNLYDLSTLKGADGQNGADGKNGVCSGYFYAQGSMTSSTTPTWETPISLDVKTNEGDLITYDSSNRSVTLKQGHTYNVSFNGSIGISAIQAGQPIAAALADGYDNNQSISSTLIKKIPNQADGVEDMSLQVPLSYNRLYMATDSDVSLSYMITRYMTMYTKLDTFTYNLTITVLN